MEAFGQAAQPLSNAGIAGFNLLDLCQQLVQIRRDDGFTHRVDEVEHNEKGNRITLRKWYLTAECSAPVKAG